MRPLNTTSRTIRRMLDLTAAVTGSFLSCRSVIYHWSLKGGWGCWIVVGLKLAKAAIVARSTPCTERRRFLGSLMRRPLEPTPTYALVRPAQARQRQSHDGAD